MRNFVMRNIQYQVMYGLIYGLSTVNCTQKSIIMTKHSKAMAAHERQHSMSATREMQSLRKKCPLELHIGIIVVLKKLLSY